MRQHNGHVVQFAAKMLWHHLSIRALARDTSSHRLTHEQKGERGARWKVKCRQRFKAEPASLHQALAWKKV